MGCRHHDTASAYTWKMTKRQRLVRNTILCTNECDVLICEASELPKCRFRVLALHREDDNISSDGRLLSRRTNGLDGNAMIAIGGTEQKAVPPKRFQVAAAGDQHHLPTRHGKPCANGAADRTRSVDEIAHQSPSSVPKTFPLSTSANARAVTRFTSGIRSELLATSARPVLNALE